MCISKHHRITHCNFLFLQNWSTSTSAILKGISRSQPRSCPFCSAVYNNKRDLNAHLEQVHGSKQQFKCLICGNILSSSNGLKSHMANHTGEQAHQCKLCYRKFAQKNHFIGHMNMHSGSKPFQCDRCLKSFRYSHHLSRHKKTCSQSLY